MVRVRASNSDNIYKIGKWFGVNENPDGDAQLKPGEASEMRNLRITRDGSLQKRPGMKTIAGTVPNMVTNGSFENGAAFWTVAGTPTISSVTSKFGTYSCRIADPGGAASYYAQNIILISGHKYYHSMWCKNTSNTTAISWIAGGGATLSFAPNATEWTRSSCVYTAGINAVIWYIYGYVNGANNGNPAYFDGAILLDLTALFGSGAEPSAAWCDANIIYCGDTLVVSGVTQRCYHSNILSNSYFINGTTTGWGTLNVTGFTAANGVAQYTATSQWAQVHQVIPVVSGHKYYSRVLLQSSGTGNLAFGLWDSVAYQSLVTINVATAGTMAAYSTIGTSGVTSSTAQILISDQRASNWTQIQFSMILTVDLTARFGAGSEPTQAWCDTYISFNGDVIAYPDANANVIKGIWHGYVNGKEYTVFAAAGNIYKYDSVTNMALSIKNSSTTFAPAPTTFFGFSQKLYILNGYQYLEWDGTMPPSTGVIPVVGYVPVISMSVPPTGGGTLKEGINKLSAVRKIWFSPDGSNIVFKLPETGLSSIDYVKDRVTGTNYTVTTDYTVSTANGTVTFVNKARTENFTANGTAYPRFTLLQNTYSITSVTVAGSGYSYQYDATTKVLTLLGTPTNGQAIVVSETYAPAMGTNTVEIQYTAATSGYSQVAAMKYVEIYNGTTDNRVFIYGDGTNKAFYSGLDGNGLERADHFPDLNVLNVGSANTPITALIRHYGQLAAFKTDGAYTVSYGTITLATGANIAAFYISPLHRTIGNTAYGQVQLVDNSPRTLFNSAIYEWRNSGNYSSNLTADERQAVMVSNRVFNTLRSMDLTNAYTFDDNERQEYYVIYDGVAVVNSYATNTWFIYTGFNMSRLIAIDGVLFGCTYDGNIVHISREYLSDDGDDIDCYWKSGALDFGKPWQLKYAADIYVTMKPEKKARVDVTVITNKKELFNIKSIAHGFMTFVDVNFGHWSFGVNRQPQVDAIRLKAKKFSFYYLIFQSCADWNNITILGAEIKVRFMGDVK